MSSKSKNSILHVNSKSKLKKTSALGSKQERRSSVTLHLDDGKFYHFFKTTCAEKRVINIPEVKCINQVEPVAHTRKVKQDSHLDVALSVMKLCEYHFNLYNKPILYVYSKNDSDDPFKIIYRNNIQSAILNVFYLMTSNFKTITILQFEYCKIKPKHLVILQAILQINPNIKYLSLDGNPLAEPNYEVVLTDTQLTHLSLKCCQISIEALKKISGILTYPKNNYLQSINLCSNYIDDVGMVHFAIALRTNRTLCSVNLADNWITDAGFKTLFRVMMKFQLTHEEVVERRKVNMVYMKEKIQLRNNVHTGVRKADSNISVLKASSIDVNKSNKSLNRKASRGNSSGSLKSRSFLAIEERIKTQIQTDAHPLMVDCYKENKAIYCIGNMSLAHLNISYNDVGIETLKTLADVLKYQTEMLLDNKTGLIKFIFDEKINELFSDEFSEISTLLKANIRKSRASMNSQDKGRIFSTGSIKSMS